MPGHGNGLFGPLRRGMKLPSSPPAKSLAARDIRCAHHGAMTDHFAILDQPRRPWLDAAALKDAFHQHSTALHPDVPGTGDTAQFVALSGAYSVLREPVSRLRHLLELCAPSALAGTSSPPPELSDLFMQIAGARHRLSALLTRRNAATSPLTRALLAGEETALRHELHAALAQLESAEAHALAEVRILDATWRETDAEAVRALALHFHHLAYLARWLAQTREALFTLGG